MINNQQKDIKFHCNFPQWIYYDSRNSVELVEFYYEFPQIVEIIYPLG